MDLEKEFPARFYMNLGPRQDRRAHTQEEFLRQQLEVERFPAVNARWVRHKRGMFSEGRYACGLTQRLIVRKARQMKAKAVLIFEDDVVLHENFRELVEAIQLPDDWGIFYFGAQHTKKPERHGLGLVRAKRALDMHAIAIRSPYYNRVIQALTPPGKINPAETDPSDVALADLHSEIPTYAAYPNLAWQRVIKSDLIGRVYSNYTGSGKENYQLDSILAFEEEDRKRSCSIFTQTGLKLHIGCAMRRLGNGWTNVERRQVDITKPLPFGDESVRFIFLEHVIEHVTARSAYDFFVECMRVLEPGGVLRLAFPDIEKIWNAQSTEYAEFLEEQGWGDGSQKSVIRTLIFEHGHRAVWSLKTMTPVLESLGFSVAPAQVGESKHPELRGLEQHGKLVGETVNEVETVCIEAGKPAG